MSNSRVDETIFEIEDYVGGNIEGVEGIDHMGFTVFLRRTLTKLIVKAKIEELEYIKSQNVAIPCQEDCDEIRHAKHEGAWEQHLEFDAAIEQRLSELTSTLKSKEEVCTKNRNQ